jgi:hypothetical protein
MQWISPVNLWERVAAWGVLAFISPIVQLIQAENGIFAFLTLGAGMLIAAQQTFIKPQSVFGPFFEEPPKEVVQDADTAC